VTAALLVVLAATTILNASVVSVDRAGRTMTVRADGEATRRLAVAPAAAGRLAALKAGSEVLLTLRDDVVVDIKISTAARTPGRIPQLPPRATSPTNRGLPQVPVTADPPQGRPVPQVAPGGTAARSPSPGVSPAGVAPTRPAVSPVAVRSPRSPGTPKPVVLPSDPPPTPLPSPQP
jgi:hypothetical protein